jgi:hypothetical protein
MALMQAFIISSFIGQAGVVNTMVNDTLLPSILISFTIFSVTRSFPRSGSCTLLRAFNISASVIVQLFVKKWNNPAKLTIETFTLLLNAK